MKKLIMKTLRPYQQETVKDAIKNLVSSDDPLLIMVSVGAGKSLIIAEIIKYIVKFNKKILCVVNNAELVRNNSATFNAQGGASSIFCASLGVKCNKNNVIFATPQSILAAIKKNECIAKIIFNLIIVDEAHMIDYKKTTNTFMRILNHYKAIYPAMRLLGATGTNFRFRGESICGEEALFKKQIGNITTASLIDQGYLVKPKFEINKRLEIDFSTLDAKKSSPFKNTELTKIINNNGRKTAKIMGQLSHVMEHGNRFGVFIFASTIAHCTECFEALPKSQTAIITGDTKQEERNKILEKARNGEIKYLINVSVLTVGVDVAPYDTICFVRPTESLVLLIQMIGRGLRLANNKKDCLILDYAGNIERHQDWDDPILSDALAQTRDKDKPKIFECYECHTLNTEFARRCVGIHNNKRCEYYFEFKECYKCGVRNDITARKCRECSGEIIDPNAKLNLFLEKAKYKIYKVAKTQFFINKYEMSLIIKIIYTCDDGNKFGESFYNGSSTSKNIMYAKLIKPHAINANKFYLRLDSSSALHEFVAEARSPLLIEVDKEKIKNKHFD